MSVWFALTFVLLIEQRWPLAYRRVVERPLVELTLLFERWFNAGRFSQGVIGWCALTLPILIAVALIHVLLTTIHPLLGWLCQFVVLYLTMGFRQFSSSFTAIQNALGSGDLGEAERILVNWRDEGSKGLRDPTASDIARLAIEEALVASHRHVFGVMLWFVILPGPAGALLYRLAAVQADTWRRRQNEDNNAYGRFAQQVFYIIDWVPLRVTAVLFAIAGNFEDAIAAWRSQAKRWQDRELAIVLASGAGAIGVDLGTPSWRAELPEDSEFAEASSDSTGVAADSEAMTRTVALGLRAALICLGLSLLVAISGFAP